METTFIVVTRFKIVKTRKYSHDEDQAPEHSDINNVTTS